MLNRKSSCISLWFVGLSLLVTGTAGADVVARVSTEAGVVNITDTRLVRYMAQHPSLSAVDALARLVDFEVLNLAARRSVPESDRLVMAAAKTVMVQRYLKREFEPLWSKDSLPEDLVRRSYERNKSHFVHPELRIASHIIVTQKNKRPTEPALDEQARTLAQQIYEDLIKSPPKNAEEFRKRAQLYQDRVSGQELEVLGQDLRRFALKGRYDPKFTEPVFAYPNPSGILEPFGTQFGFHIVRLDAVIPEKNESFESVKKSLRQRIVPEVRTLKLIALTDELAAELPKLNPAPGARGLVNPAPLLSLEVGSQKGQGSGRKNSRSTAQPPPP